MAYFKLNRTPEETLREWAGLLNYILGNSEMIVTDGTDTLSVNTDGSINTKLQVGANTVSETNPVPIVGGVKTTYETTALAASGVIKNAAGTLYGLSGVNNSASDQYLHIYNTASVPADATVPKVVISIPAKSNFSFDVGVYGYAFSTGMSWSNSSTLATKTIGSADCWLIAVYS